MKKEDDVKEPPSSESDDDVTAEDLICLVRAIKFAHPEMSMKNVHKEISTTIPASDDSCAFLKGVKLDEVKKVWKKALKNPAESKNKPSDDLQPAIPTTDKVIKFYTVGDGTVKTLAENYSKHHAQLAIETLQKEKEEKEEDLSNYTHFFLDVPANLSGTRPHQALINFNDNSKNNKTKKKSKSPKESSSDGRYICKIQVAQSEPGMPEDTPMLLYNHCRTAKTFIHPPSSEDNGKDDGGYKKIKEMITNSGSTGAKVGGLKAYFYGRITETKKGPDIISIDLSELAPTQTW